MPQVIAPIAAAVGTAAFGAGSVGAIVTTAVTASVLKGAMYYGISAGISALAGGGNAPSLSDLGGGRQLQFAPASNAPRQFVYGETVVVGQPVLTKTSGEDRQYLDMIVAIGETGDPAYESIEAIYFDEDELTLDGSGNVTTPSKYSGYAQIVTALGGDSQTAISDAVTNVTEWTSDHRGRGVCHAYVRLTHDSEVWTAGQPRIKFKVRGRKVYDPRLDSTNGGSGSHRLADSSTWEWSANRVLWSLDWLRGIDMNGTRVAGLGAPDALFDWSSWSDAADDAEETVSVSGGGTITRYTGGGGLVATDDDPVTVARAMALCYAGEFAPRSGYIATFAGVARTATVTLDDDDLAGPVKLRTAQSMRTTVNTVQAQYRESEENDKMTDAPEYSNGTWVTLDGEEYYRQISLPFENDHRRAQRISKVFAGRVRAPRRLEAPFKQTALKVREGDAFTWSSNRFPSGVTGKYICTNRQINSDGTVQISARSEDDTIYDWDESTEEATRTTPASISEPATGFDLSTFDPVAYRNSVLAGIGAPTLSFDFAAGDFDANTGGAVAYEDALKLGSGLVQDSGGSTLNDGDVRNDQISSTDADSSNLLRYAGGDIYTGALDATLGADWSSNLSNRPTELTDGRISTGLDANGILLTNISTSIANSSDLLRYTSGGVFTGDLDSTAGADWSSNLSNRPTELTDGRVSTALNSNGVLRSSINTGAANASDLLRYTSGGLFTGDLNSTAGATWGSDITSQPTWSTDDRVPDTITSAKELDKDTKIVQSTSGSTGRSLGRALDVIEVQDGDSVTFTDNFGAPPRVRLLNATGLVYATSLESSGTVNQFQKLLAANVTTSGFSVTAKLQVAATTTAQSDNVQTTGTGSEPDVVGHKSTADEAVDDTYRFAGNVAGTLTGSSGTIIVGIYTASSSGVWVQRATTQVLFSTSGTQSWTANAVVDGLGQHNEQEFGISVESSIGFSGSPTLSAGVVTYNSAASITDTTATPDDEVVYAYVFESDDTLS